MTSSCCLKMLAHVPLVSCIASVSLCLLNHITTHQYGSDSLTDKWWRNELSTSFCETISVTIEHRMYQYGEIYWITSPRPYDPVTSRLFISLRIAWNPNVYWLLVLGHWVRNLPLMFKILNWNVWCLCWLVKLLPFSQLLDVILHLRLKVPQILAN